MERVKLTFEKSDHGDKVTIQKDGGFTVDDMGKLTEVVEELFNGPELEAGEPDRAENEISVGGDGTGDQDSEEEPFVTRVKREAVAAAAKQKVVKRAMQTGQVKPEARP